MKSLRLKESPLKPFSSPYPSFALVGLRNLDLEGSHPSFITMVTSFSRWFFSPPVLPSQEQGCSKGALLSPTPASLSPYLQPSSSLFLPCITYSLGSWVLSPWGISQWKPLWWLAHSPWSVSVKTLWSPRGTLLASDQGQSSCINSAGKLKYPVVLAVWSLKLSPTYSTHGKTRDQPS